jgi:YD repeat-containing protein
LRGQVKNELKRTGDADGAGPTLPSIEERFYNVDGELEESRDAAGSATNFHYDALGYLDLVTLPPMSAPDYGRPTIRFVNGPLGDVLSETDPRGNSTFYAYSARRELVEVRRPDPDGLSGPLSEFVSSFGFDAAGQLEYETHAGYSTSRVYDALGRLTFETNPRGFTRAWVYDKNGNVTQAIDEMGYVTELAYDARDRLKQVLGEDPDLEDEEWRRIVILFFAPPGP